MNRLPKGLSRMTKEDFVTKSLIILDKETFPSSLNERIGVEWSKLNNNFSTNKSVRW